MPTIILCVAPFFNDAATAPPPFPPLLTDQQELFRICAHSSGLLADEALSLHNVALTAKTSAPLKPSMVPVFKLVRGSSPYLKRTVKHPPTQSNTHSPATLSDLSDLSDFLLSDSDETLSTLSEDTKIPKPPGEPGQPERGGYNLETALNWNHKAYGKLKKLMYRLVDEQLNVTKCASMQNPAHLQAIRDKALTAIPDLDNYSNCWPVNDMVMMHLKYTASRAQLRELELAAMKGKKAVKASAISDLQNSYALTSQLQK